MAWNDPPGNNNDPWGNRGDQGPPDLDEAIKKLQGQLSGIFGGKKDGSGPTGGTLFRVRSLGFCCLYWRRSIFIWVFIRLMPRSAV